MNVRIASADDMLAFGEKLGKLLRGRQVIELLGDVGAGKTTFTKGLAKGLGVIEDVQSPTFTISRIYPARDGLELAHYDFYRLSEPGVLQMEVAESVASDHMVTVVEWGEIIAGVLPDDRIIIRMASPSENERELVVESHGPISQAILEAML